MDLEHLTPPPPCHASVGRLAAAVMRVDADFFDRPPAAIAADLARCKVGLLGLADDTGVRLNHGRPGAAQGPAAFRAAFAKYGVAERMDQAGPGLRGDHPPFPRIADFGDIVPGDTLAETHRRVTLAATAILQAGLLPVGIGGGHDLTYAFVRAAAGSAGVRAGLYIDPHLDVRPTDGSGMPFRRLLDERCITSLLNVGAEPLVNCAEHYAYFLSAGGVILPAELASHDPAGVFRRLPDAPAFLSIDLDAIDASAAPGVSAINPCGMSVHTVAAIAQAAGQDPRVRCMDIMELCPAHDEQGRTARVAVYLFLRFLSGLAARKA